MFASVAAIALFAILAISADASPWQARSTSPRDNSFGRRTLPGGDCQCPADLNGDSGVLINFFSGYQCAYAGGACTWNDNTGALQNTDQTNCPTNAPCSTDTSCSCPTDNNGDTGDLINQFTDYQCAYPNGACLWNIDGTLRNTGQANCPSNAPCQQSGSDS
ncbi:uncharacterized protein PHACADRAFT_152228 [Phanerochaete carnosa HHB-10118-sp]|uniref:Uncharacterized protein n=1 Tax=Phanerochaete carnosa (strain HHB-10118-sp) TaxID=650164 RepID=K5VJF3_PHACS|nr:uncharacterized protein PHACADRAFT_152228 [Phanerochaete carnosa HHB-10118-sp]EKM51468.1 hypothetical protein PHACADRAFT_152228 [Phanerochaete carnosa HHB-10118-sp]